MVITIKETFDQLYSLFVDGVPMGKCDKLAAEGIAQEAKEDGQKVIWKLLEDQTQHA